MCSDRQYRKGQEAPSKFPEEIIVKKGENNTEVSKVYVPEDRAWATREALMLLNRKWSQVMGTSGESSEAEFAARRSRNEYEARSGITQT